MPLLVRGVVVRHVLQIWAMVLRGWEWFPLLAYIRGTMLADMGFRSPGEQR